MIGSLVVARGNKCCSLYRTVLQGSKTGVAIIGGVFTKKVWHQRIGHTKVEVCEKRKFHRKTLVKFTSMKRRGSMLRKREIFVGDQSSWFGEIV